MLRDYPADFDQVSVYILRRAYEARSGSDWASCLHGIIESQFDVDRLDYLIRDSSRAGTDYWTIDRDRLLESLEIRGGQNESWQLALSTRAVSAVESLLYQRMQYYRWVIFHPASLIADTALNRSFNRLMEDSWDFAPGVVIPEALDYIGQWSPRGALGAPLSFSVDDARVLELLRAKREHLARTQSGDKAVAFDVLMRVATEGTTSYVPAWKNYEEFLSALLTKKDSLSPTPSRGRRQANDLAKILTSTLADIRVQLPGQADTDMDLEMYVESYLNRVAPEMDGVRGEWLVAIRSRFSAIKKTYTNLWSRDVESQELQFSRLSPVYEGLASSQDKQPSAWAFFVPWDRTAKLPKRPLIAEKFIDSLLQLKETTS